MASAIRYTEACYAPGVARLIVECGTYAVARESGF
jgi:hypothetical protein